MPAIPILLFTADEDENERNRKRLTASELDRIVGGFGAVRRTSAKASLLGSTIPPLEYALW